MVHLGYMVEYVKMDIDKLKNELNKLIKKYNKIRGTYLFVYASALTKANIPDFIMSKDDYYTFYDMLSGIHSKNIDVFIETPGGSALMSG